MALDPVTGAAYNANIYSVSPNSSSVVFKDDNGTFPGSMPNHYIWNIGRTEVYAETINGTKFGWIGAVSDTTLRPGEHAVLTNFGKSYYVLGLRVHNRSDARAIVHASSSPYGNYALYGANKGSIDFIFHNTMRECITFGAKYMPTIGPSLADLLKIFWPGDDKAFAWERVQKKVNKMIDYKTQHAIVGVLEGDVKKYKERMDALLTQIAEAGEENRGDVATNYMSIAQDLVGFESKFAFSQNQPDYQKINYSLLPLYSTVITLKMGFYCRGIVQAKEIGLTDSNVDDIKSISTKLIHDHNGAINYIIDMYRERVTNIYNTAYPEDLYNMMMNTRCFIAIYGLEYIPKWKAMLTDPSSDGKIYNDVVSYSQFYGSQTPDLYHKALPEEVPAPLTPKLVNGKRNRMTQITVFKAVEGGGDEFKISGLGVTFENEDPHTMGWSSTWNKEEIKFKGTYLTKLVAKGREVLDQLVFTFSDGREVKVGSVECDHSTTFQLENHHIVGMYSSTGRLKGQIANIAVSYQRNDTLIL